MLTEIQAKQIRKEPRFRGIEKLNSKKILLTSSMMYGDEIEYVNKAFQSGVSDENIDALEDELARFVGVKNAIALSSGTSALHLAVRLAAEKIYGSADDVNRVGSVNKGGTLCGHHVFCSDFTSSAAVNPVIYEGGSPVFIDASSEDWGMDPEVLELAFDRYPDVKIVIMAHVYGFPGQIKRIKEVCEKHGALLIEDACESFGATVDGKQTGSFGDYGVLSFHKDQIITGTGGGTLLTNDSCETRKVRNWVSQASERTPWGWQEELGYNYRMSDVIAGIIRGQIKHVDENIAKKKAIYERYREGFPEDLILMNPIGEDTEPNYWMSCMTVESNIVFKETRSEWEYTYVSQHGTAAPMEILEALEAFGVVGRTVWKPMHMQPVYQGCDQMTLEGSKRVYEGTCSNNLWIRSNESVYMFERGLCLPSDIGMTEEEQETVIDIILSCFNKRDMDRDMWHVV